ncbi:Hypothetical protein NCS54_00012000 [Fusarium falciforme]|uniref:Hypothetical protein n=1 Tax=Fusarium falciforme TaxID=195108 RepID=UPI0023017AAE|nr:Hypothetical protein NCS54_00012000 [Fusarium falciforme]WAO82942.1 Hypothetical protein NCS54_00012000 [Fusarium falciforme]
MPRRKRTKRDVESLVEVVAEQKPFPLLMLPELVFHLIFSYLKPSEMSGISRSSTSFRSLLLPYVFYAVRFDGTAADISRMLEAFLYHRRQRVMQTLWESVRCFTVSPNPARGKTRGVEVMNKLPNRILEGLRRTARVRTVVLDLDNLAHGLQERFIMSLKASPGWPEVTNLSVTTTGRYAESIVNHWLPDSVNCRAPWDRNTLGALTRHSTMPFRAMSNGAGQLTRMYLGHNLLVIRTRANLPCLLTPWVGEEVRKQLEWLVIGYFDAWHKPYLSHCTINTVSDSERLAGGTQCLIEILAIMPRLRRFAFWVDRRGLGPCLVRQVWTIGPKPLTMAEVDDWYTNLVQNIAKSLPKLEKLAIMDNNGVVYVGTRALEGHDITVSREMLEAGSQRFPQGIYD